MLSLMRISVGWQFCKKLLLSLIIFSVISGSGLGGETTVTMTTAAHEWDDGGTDQAVSEVLVLAIDPVAPSTLYAGTQGSGVFKSTNGGGSWQAMNAGLPNPVSVQSLLIHPLTPTTLYAGTDWGVFKSNDGGAIWQSANQPRSITAMALDPQAPSRVYAGGACPGAFRSDNDGQSWTAINTGLAMSVFGFPVLPFLTSLVIDPSAPATLYAGALEKVYKTTNRGASWQTVYEGFSVFGLSVSGITALIVDPVTPTTVYAGITSRGQFSGSGCSVSLENLTGGVIKSNNGGRNWFMVSHGLPGGVSVIALAVDPLMPATVYAGTKRHGVFKSDDGGASWTAMNEGLPVGIVVNALAVDPQTPSTVYAGTNRGVFKSTEGGAQWEATGSL